MDLFLQIDINLISMTVLGLVFLIAFRRLDQADVLNRVYLFTILTVIVQLSFESISCIINGRTEIWIQPISIFFRLLLLATAPLVTYSFYILIFNLVSLRDERAFSYKKWLFLPVVFNTFFILISLFFGWAFVINSNHLYVIGDFFFIPMIVTYIYLVFGVVRIICNKKNVSPKEFVLLIIFAFMPIIGGVLQSFFQETLLMWSSTAIALLALYVYLQERMIHNDRLTGAWSRKSFDYYIRQKLRRKLNEPFGAIYFDIKKLRTINENFGLLEGDSALKQVIALIKGLIGLSDIVARLGGDEFIIIVQNPVEDRLKLMIQDIKLALSVYNENANKTYTLECRCNYGIYTDEYKSIDHFMRSLNPHLDDIENHQ